MRFVGAGWSNPGDGEWAKLGRRVLDGFRGGAKGSTAEVASISANDVPLFDSRHAMSFFRGRKDDAETRQGAVGRYGRNLEVLNAPLTRR